MKTILTLGNLAQGIDATHGPHSWFMFACLLREVEEWLDDPALFSKNRAGLLDIHEVDPAFDLDVNFVGVIRDAYPDLYNAKLTEELQEQELNALRSLCSRVIEGCLIKLGKIYRLKTAFGPYKTGSLVELNFKTGEIASVTPIMWGMDVSGFSIDSALLEQVQ